MSKTEMRVGWTKGPWSVVHKVPTLVNGNFRSVADTACGRDKRLDLAEDLANARLIAKAPQLVECLREMVENFTSSDPELVAIRKRANALLAEIGGAGLTVTNSK